MSKIAGLSELQLIYKFLQEYENSNAAVFKDGNQYAATLFDDETGTATYYNGDTISDAVRKFYEQESELESDKP